LLEGEAAGRFRVNPQGGEGAAHLGRFGHEDHVHEAADRTPHAYGDAVYGSDDGLGVVDEAFQEPGKAMLRRSGFLAHFRKVCAGGEGPALTRQHHHGNGAVLRSRLEPFHQRIE